MASNQYPGLNLNQEHALIAKRSEETVFGFWVYLMSDMIIFGLFFATYMISWTPTGIAGGPGPKDIFHLSSVAWQTAFLLASSFTCGLAGLALKYDEGAKRVALWLAVTGILGALFLIFEVRDFNAWAAAGAVPMRSNWLSATWAVLALHGLHIFAGLVTICVMIGLLFTRELTPRNQTRILCFMLFWHFLDLIWVGIFTIVFLRGLV